ncbi:hypothetical protein QR680_017403 [Steinernema hermaphroditum]|uniref:Cytosolic fatty-acid binding proteins domain-containing protein n=1 Tax=Steinernema hermaphroditum TaxID=289476 RepID=A0AA39HFM0_9BILA|nr:hypothetical protein QR680_017403 [Steinernema hermaphroditum]
MIHEVDHCVGDASGVLLVHRYGGVSASFLLQHFVSHFMKNGGNVVACCLSDSETFLRTAASKLAIRVEPNRLSCIDLGGFLSTSLNVSGGAVVDYLKERIHLALKNDVKNLVVFDDASCLEAFAGEMWKVYFSRMLLSLKHRMSAGSLIVGAVGEGTVPLWTEFSVRIAPIGTGFSKEISAVVVIEKSGFRNGMPSRTYHACIRDRSAKFFVPGAVRPLFFFGAFKLERSENFDEYLASKGVGFFLRKLIGFSSVTKVFSEGDQADRYNMENRTSKKNLVYKNWSLDQPFEDEGLDGQRHKITFGMANSGELMEHHLRLEIPNDAGETYLYSIDGDYLVLKMQNESVSCRRFFKRIPGVKQ